MLAGGLANGIVYFDFGGGGHLNSAFFDDTTTVLDLACSVLLGRRAVDTRTETMVRVGKSGVEIRRRNHHIRWGGAIGSGCSRRHRRQEGKQTKVRAENRSQQREIERRCFDLLNLAHCFLTMRWVIRKNAPVIVFSRKSSRP